jgi:hypothetical protein
MNAGVKKFKLKGVAGVTKELTQMHTMNVFRPTEVESLTYDEKKKALSSLMFLKEKRDSSVKARMCADGHKQMDGTWAKQGTTSPTVVTESVFITAVIDGHKGRNVACFVKNRRMLPPPSNTTATTAIDIERRIYCPLMPQHSCPSRPSNTNDHLRPLPPSNSDARRHQRN